MKHRMKTDEMSSKTMSTPQIQLSRARHEVRKTRGRFYALAIFEQVLLIFSFAICTPPIPSDPSDYRLYPMKYLWLLVAVATSRTIAWINGTESVEGVLLKPVILLAMSLFAFWIGYQGYFR